MNDKIRNYLSRLKVMGGDIATDLECIQMDLDDVEDCEDLFVISSAIERIVRAAEDMKWLVREAEDAWDDESI